jgi:hypothetical protein
VYYVKGKRRAKPEKGLKGSRIASFREPLAAWKITVRVFGIACLLFGFVGRLLYGNLNSGAILVWVGFLAALLTTPRYLRFYDRGLSVPKAASSVFLSREQLMEMKLDGDRFIVTGPDATWGGPYSGGVFRIRTKDLRNFQDVLARFQCSLGDKSNPERATSKRRLQCIPPPPE